MVAESSSLILRARLGVREAMFRWYPTAEAFARFRAWRRTRGGRQPLLVYQMGKVASTSVARSLEAAGYDPVFQIHTLTEDGIGTIRARYRRHWAADIGGWHLWYAQHARRLVARRSTQWTVVTMFREPVARNVSAFFQSAELRHRADLDRLLARVDEPDLPATLTEDFLRLYEDHDLGVRWFDDELRAVFGVDVYARPFPHDVGWQVLESPRARVLLIRFEDMRRVFPEAIDALLGCGPLELRSENVSEGKRHGSVYRRMVDEGRLPDDYLDRMYSSRYARHFYTDEERAAFRARWSRA